MDGGGWQAIVHGFAESDPTERAHTQKSPGTEIKHDAFQIPVPPPTSGEAW